MKMDYVKEAKNIFDKEILAINKTKDSLDEEFNIIVNLILNCEGKVIVTGMGKPGHIGTKIAATMASLGIPSFFMHPGEALHGDLGMVEKEDVVLLISYSGESEEITKQLPVLAEIGCITVAITGNKKSSLARQTLYQYIFPEFEEACYMNLAPTSSTTALLVLGDALALVISKAKNYSKEDFGLHHPAGALGKKLLIHVSDVMHSNMENAIVYLGCSLKNTIVEMSSKGLSSVSVVDSDGCLKGIITDGDLRRMLEKGINVYSEIIDNVMTKNPKYIYEYEMAVDALQYMSDSKITSLPVLDREDKVVGTILLTDIYKAGVVQ